MKLYKLTQNRNTGYDTYDSCVVCAKNEDDAKTIAPWEGEFKDCDESWGNSWARKISEVICEEIGKANKGQERGVLCASFNAC